MNHGLIPYIGGKHRLANRLVEYCALTGAQIFIDVFGGSAAVTIPATQAFKRVVYNDIDGDMVNLFRVVADRPQRRQLLQALRWLPPSRQIFNDDAVRYVSAGLSFHAIKDPVERARCTLYRALFSFGGKMRNGGFMVSTGDPEHIKEVQRYRNVLRKIVKVGEIFRGVMIENLDYQEMIRIYGQRPEAVLFVDPPYVGTERHYSREFGRADHVFLANQLAATPARVVCTYYDTPLVRELYPESAWTWSSIQGTKNCCLARGNKVVTDEFVIVKK